MQHLDDLLHRRRHVNRRRWSAALQLLCDFHGLLPHTGVLEHRCTSDVMTQTMRAGSEVDTTEKGEHTKTQYSTTAAVTRTVPAMNGRSMLLFHTMAFTRTRGTLRTLSIQARMRSIAPSGAIASKYTEPELDPGDGDTISGSDDATTKPHSESRTNIAPSTTTLILTPGTLSSLSTPRT
jgi:hypothetical protein